MKNLILSIVVICSFSLLTAKDYKGAELRTIESYTYGRFEICYKSVKGTGVLANFFNFHDFTTSTADWNEIDIEILGRYDDDIQFTTITPGQKIYNSHTYSSFNPADNFHVYAFEWTPEHVAWFVDGEELYRQTGSHISTLTRPQKIMMNIWAPDGAETWTGEWNPEILPLFAFYDWVSHAAYTPGSGDTGTDNNFTLLWRDDFDSLNTERWEKATHTWGGNRVDFTPENAVFKDGKLILCLTDAENTGMVDNQPPVILWARAEENHVLVRFSEELDSISAVNPASYGITNVEIFSIEFTADKRTVILHTSEIVVNKSYSLAAFNIKDNSSEGNIRSYDIVKIINNSPISFPFRVNIGGDAIFNNKYLPDQVWGPEVEYGRMDGWVEEWNVDIGGTDEDSLYQTGCHEIVKYKVRVPVRSYSIQLMMAENWFDQIGSRVFGIFVEGNSIVTDLDIVKVAGKHQAYQVNASDVSVLDGILDIHFVNWTDKPVLNGLIIEQVSNKINDQDTYPPRSFNLYQNYPNPFNPETIIRYALPDVSDVILTIYNRLGQKIQYQELGIQQAGMHQKTINLQLASGVYFYRLSAASCNRMYVDVKKMIVLK